MNQVIYSVPNCVVVIGTLGIKNETTVFTNDLAQLSRETSLALLARNPNLSPDGAINIMTLSHKHGIAQNSLAEAFLGKPATDIPSASADADKCSEKEKQVAETLQTLMNILRS